jgi:hypothetical protein
VTHRSRWYEALGGVLALPSRVLARGRPAPNAVAAPEMVRILADRLELADGRVACTLAVRGYPREVGPGWLQVLHELDGEYRYSQHIEPVDTATALAELTRDLRDLRASLLLAEARGAEQDALDRNAAHDAEALRDALARGHVRLFRHHLLLTLFAEDPARLRQRVAAAMALLEGRLLWARRCLLEEAEAFASTMPLGRLAVPCPRNIDTDALSAAPPFGSGDLQGSAGEFWGLDVRQRTAVVVDRFALHNPHALCLAASGAGKSFWMKHLLVQNLLAGRRAVVVDPQGEYGGWCAALGGVHVRLGAGSPVGLHPLATPRGADVEGWRAARADRLVELLTVLCGSGLRLTPGAVQGALAVADAAAGGADPTLEQVGAALQEQASTRAAGQRLLAALAGPLAPFRGGTTWDPDGQLVVFDLQEAVGQPRQLLAAFLLLLTRYLVDHLVDPGAPALTVAVDEAHHLLREPVGARFLEVLFRSGRKRGVAVCLATQSVGDLLGAEADPEASRAARAALANAAIAFLMRQQNAREVAWLRELYHLGASEADWLLGCRRGEGLLLAGGRRALVRVEVPADLQGLYRADPAPGARPRGP